MSQSLRLDDAAFEYEELDYSTDSLRLIQILPGSGEELIRCTIENTSIRANYNAVSYEWGSEDGYRVLEICGKPYQVRRNLWDFLQLARANGLARMSLWIDAICIDQHNLAERKHQVYQMGSIYANASVVYIWLGLGVLDAFCSDLLNLSQHAPIGNLRDRARVKIQHLNKTGTDWLDGLRSFYNATYWSRLWIVQEVLLAESLLLFLGSLVVQWDILHALLEELQNQGYLCPPKVIKDSISASGVWSLCVNRVRQIKGDGSNTLESLLHDYGDHGCADPRDRIFGLLSLVDGGVEFQIDYAVQNKTLVLQALSFCKPSDFVKLGTCLMRLLDVSISDLAKPSLTTRAERRPCSGDSESQNSLDLELTLLGYCDRPRDESIGINTVLIRRPGWGFECSKWLRRTRGRKNVWSNPRGFTELYHYTISTTGDPVFSIGDSGIYLMGRPGIDTATIYFVRGVPEKKWILELFQNNITFQASEMLNKELTRRHPGESTAKPELQFIPQEGTSEDYNQPGPWVRMNEWGLKTLLTAARGRPDKLPGDQQPRPVDSDGIGRLPRTLHHWQSIDPEPHHERHNYPENYLRCRPNGSRLIPTEGNLLPSRVHGCEQDYELERISASSSYALGSSDETEPSLSQPEILPRAMKLYHHRRSFAKTLSDLDVTFISMSGDYGKCRRFVSQNPNLSRVSMLLYLEVAAAALRSGKSNYANSCIEQACILWKMGDGSGEREEFFDGLEFGRRKELHNFHNLCNELEERVRMRLWDDDLDTVFR